ELNAAGHVWHSRPLVRVMRSHVQATEKACMTTLARLVAVAVAAGSVAAASTVAASPAATSQDQPPSIQAASVDHVQVVAPRRLLVNGQITCSKGAHFHAYALILDPATGALAKGKTPPKFPRRSAEYARYKAMTRCTGAGQSWTMQARSTGRPPLQFAPGQLKACVTFDVTKHHRYSDLKNICAVLTA